MATDPLGGGTSSVTFATRNYPQISLPDGPLSPFGPSVALDRAVVASALHTNPRTGEALALAASAILYFRLHRTELLAFAEIVTDLADMIDGDPDFEDATDAEDDHALSPDALFFGGNAAGCNVSDPGEPSGDEHGDTSWTEFHTRGRHKDNPGVFTTDGRQLQEDMEDDDNDACLAADDIGTHHDAKLNILFYSALGDHDLELNGDEGDYSR